MEDEKEAVQSVAEKQVEEVSRGASRLAWIMSSPANCHVRCASTGSTSRAWCVAHDPPLGPLPAHSSLVQLTNLGALPLSRMHSTLNMLAPGYKGKTVDELTALLEKVAAEGLVTKTASGSWKIVK